MIIIVGFLISLVYLQMRTLATIELVGEKLAVSTKEDFSEEELDLSDDDWRREGALMAVADALEFYAADKFREAAADEQVTNPFEAEKYPDNLGDLEPKYVNFGELGVGVDQFSYRVMDNGKKYVLGIKLSERPGAKSLMIEDDGNDPKLYEVSRDLN